MLTKLNINDRYLPISETMKHIQIKAGKVTFPYPGTTLMLINSYISKKYLPIF